MTEPAFPNPRWEGWGNPQEGMSLRDYFAAKVAQGIYARVNWHPEDVAERAYIVADEMMKAREQ
jgi:hypothetical protein